MLSLETLKTKVQDTLLHLLCIIVQNSIMFNQRLHCQCYQEAAKKRLGEDVSNKHFLPRYKCPQAGHVLGNDCLNTSQLI